MSAPRVRAMLYAALIVYGSLFPFHGWRPSGTGLFEFLAHVPDFHADRTDALANVLAYMPLGFFAVRDLRRRSAPVSIVSAALAGAALSFTMEFIQQFLPGRVASINDLTTNAAGCVLGACVGAMTRIDMPAGAALVRWRSRWLGRGSGEELGVIAIALWALSQWAPLVPSFDVGELRSHLAPLWSTLVDPERFDASRFAVYALDVAGLALLARTLGPDNRLVLAFAALALVVVPVKPIFAGRVLSLEALAGTLAGAFVAAPAVAAPRRASAVVALVLLLAALAIAELRHDTSRVFYPFTWIPFRAELESPLSGMESLLETLWPAVALAYLARFATPRAYHAYGAWLGGAALLLFVFALEWSQQYVAGRVGDVTPVLLMVATWASCWIVMSGSHVANAPHGAGSQSMSTDCRTGDRR